MMMPTWGRTDDPGAAPPVSPNLGDLPGTKYSGPSWLTSTVCFAGKQLGLIPLALQGFRLSQQFAGADENVA